MQKEVTVQIKYKCYTVFEAWHLILHDRNALFIREKLYIQNTVH